MMWLFVVICLFLLVMCRRLFVNPFVCLFVGRRSLFDGRCVWLLWCVV